MLETYTETAQQLADDYVARATGVVETDASFRQDNPEMTIKDYALDLIDGDIETATATRQIEWRRDLKKVRRLIERIVEEDVPAVPEVIRPEITIEKGQILSIENPKSWNKIVEGKRVKVYEVRPDGRIAASYVDKADIKRFSAKMFIFEREELLPKPPAVEKVKFGGGNPMKTESERKSFHERIFGKGSTPPLERLGRGETVNNLLPMSPEEGPPLPRGLKLKWPWKK